MAEQKEEKKKERPVVTIQKNEQIEVTYRYNRKYDLHIGRYMETFKARETKKIPKKWLEHRDWKNVAKNFVIKGA